MTHDPLCPWEPETLWTGESSDLIYYRRPEIPCQCDLIAKVVDREQAKATKVTTGGTFGPGVDGITDTEVTAFLEKI